MAAAAKLCIASMPNLLRGITQSGSTLSSSSLKIATVFQAQEDATITHVGLLVRTVTGTAPTYKIGLQGVDTSGNPDGTYKGGGSPASGTFTPASTGITWVALDNSYAVTRGQDLSLVIEYSSGTVNASNCIAVGVSSAGIVAQVGKPFWATYNGTSWSKQSAWTPLYGYRSSTNRYGMLHNGTAATNVTASGRRAAAKFALAPFLGTYSIRGFAANMNSISSGGTYKIGIWDTSGTVLQSTTSIDSDFEASLGSTAMEREYFFSGSLATLTFGTNYYIGFEHIGTSFWLEALTLSEANDFKLFSGEGDFALGTWNGSAWSDSSTAIVPVRLMLDTVSVGTGSSGPTTGPDFGGGWK